MEARTLLFPRASHWKEHDPNGCLQSAVAVRRSVRNCASATG